MKKYFIRVFRLCYNPRRLRTKDEPAANLTQDLVISGVERFLGRERGMRRGGAGRKDGGAICETFAAWVRACGTVEPVSQRQWFPHSGGDNSPSATTTTATFTFPTWTSLVAGRRPQWFPRNGGDIILSATTTATTVTLPAWILLLRQELIVVVLRTSTVKFLLTQGYSEAD